MPITSVQSRENVLDMLAPVSDSDSDSASGPGPAAPASSMAASRSLGTRAPLQIAAGPRRPVPARGVTEARTRAASPCDPAGAPRGRPHSSRWRRAAQLTSPQTFPPRPRAATGQQEAKFAPLSSPAGNRGSPGAITPAAKAFLPVTRPDALRHATHSGRQVRAGSRPGDRGAPGARQELPGPLSSE